MVPLAHRDRGDPVALRALDRVARSVAGQHLASPSPPSVTATAPASTTTRRGSGLHHLDSTLARYQLARSTPCD